MGGVVREYIHVDFLIRITTYPYSTCISFFAASLFIFYGGFSFFLQYSI